MAAAVVVYLPAVPLDAKAEIHIDATEMQEWLEGANSVEDRIAAYEDALSSIELRQGEPWKKRGMYWDRDEFRDDDD